jgi:hypothetical protein
MDARIKSGHDECVLWRKVEDRMISIFKQRHRHCERSEAIHLATKKEWIASSLRSSHDGTLD